MIRLDFVKNKNLKFSQKNAFKYHRTGIEQTKISLFEKTK